jgi:hypothetical protein
VNTQSDAADPPPELTPLEVARRYHDAWTQKNFEEASRYLAADLQTDVPLNSYADAAEFLAGLAGFGQLVTKVDLLAELGDSHQAALLYDVYVDPIGTLRVAEHFTVAENHITHIRHVHDTVALRAAGFAGS